MAPSSRRNLLTAGGMMLAASSTGFAGTQTVKQQPAPVLPAPIAHDEPPVAKPGLSSFVPPATDTGDLGALTFSFANARTQQTGAGWIRTIDQRDLPIAKTMSATNMRLQAGSIRAAHWQAGAEWGFVQDGAMRLSSVDHLGRHYDADLGAGDIWFVPCGLPRSMQGLGPDGCTLLITHETGDSKTASLLDWINHTPHDLLARDLGTDPATFKPLPDHDPLLFAAPIPGSLTDDQSRQHQASVPAPFHFPFMSVRPIEAKGGRIRIADMNNFRASTKLSATLVDLEPGGMRELHFHPNANGLTMILAGSGRMTVFAGKTGANTVDLAQNSVAYIPRLWGHTIENTGSEPMRFLEILDAGEYRDISLKNWLANMPPALMSAHLGIDAAFFRNLGKDKTPIVPV